MQKNLECPKCGRKFSMPAHLARHMSSHDGAASKKKASRKTRARKAKRGPGRPKGSTNKKAATTAARSVAGFNLRGMQIQELSDLIDAARDEARRKLHELDIQLSTPSTRRRR